MRTSFMVLASLLLLLLATRTHGIRLDRQLHQAINRKGLGDTKAGQPSNAVRDAISRHCTSDGHCSGTTMEQTTPTTANVVKDREAASAYARPVPRFHEDYYGPGKTQKPLAPHAESGAAKNQISPKRNDDTQSRHAAEVASHGGQEVAPRAPRVLPRQATYPDVLDIAGMDYSPATRKPPIHN